ncbi:MAG: methyl-accepting chemotaxis protein, partial [Candidatus Sumerlaeia bacterium]
NAANAEESASAAEELSAQAHELNDTVASLVSIVRGQNSAAAKKSAPSPAAKRPVTAQARQPIKAAKEKVPAHAGARSAKANPEQVIPLNDSEMGEF